MSISNSDSSVTVSIIVPIYNVEKYIVRCVHSLLRQDYESIEIILVDDGSPDNSGTLADHLALEDSRIKVIHKCNGGVSSARNAGIDAAKGEWITFVDGDDWVEPDYISYLLSTTLDTGCLLGMGLSYYSDSGQIKLANEIIDCSVPAETAIEWIYDGTLFVAVWNRIYRADLLQVVRFSEQIWYGEGMLFNIEVLQCVDDVGIGVKPVYHQTYNPESAMRRFSLQSNYCGIASLWLQRAIWKKTTPSIERQWHYHRYRFNQSIIVGMVSAGIVERERDAFRECVRNMRHDLIHILQIEHRPKEAFGLVMYSFAPKIMAKRRIAKLIDQAAQAV